MTSTGPLLVNTSAVVDPGGAPSDSARVPAIDECHFEYPPIPAPNVACWFPTDDESQLWGIGSTREAAYANMVAILAGSDLWDPHGDIERDMAGIDPYEDLPVERGRGRSAT